MPHPAELGAHERARSLQGGVPALVEAQAERSGVLAPDHARILDLDARVRMFQPEALDMETVFMKLTEGKTA